MTDEFILFENALNEYSKFNNRRNSSDSENLSDFENEIYDVDIDTENIKTIRKDSFEILNKSSVSIPEICTHNNISTDNIVIYCIDCGKELEKTLFQEKEWRYYGQSDNKRTSDPNRVHLRKNDDKSIFKDVENMGFSDKIVSLANHIYMQVTQGQIFRGNSRKSIIFSCIFHSFKIQGKPQSRASR
jgi:hypothetical protein